MEKIIYLIDQINTNNDSSLIINSLLVFLATYLFLHIIKISIISRYKKIAQTTQTDIDDLIVNISNSLGGFFFFIVSLYFALSLISLPDNIEQFVNKAAIIIFVYYGITILSAIIRHGFRKILKNKKELEAKQDITIIKVISSITQVILWIIAILIILQNFNYDVSTLVGGLGITGIAVAFGMQNILKDVFAFISILFDKPFTIGDSIEIDNTFGTVKQIGIRSTRLKTLTGDELIIPNQDITQKWIRNFKKLKKRRVEFNLGVVYTTPKLKLEKIPQIIENIIKPIDKCEFRRCDLKNLGDSALVFETVYMLNSTSFAEYTQVRAKINLGILNEFKKNRIEIAFPTQTIHIEK
ncbi:MAG: mechanosensitive ion channel family protein [Patescibacteria group bacterium]